MKKKLVLILAFAMVLTLAVGCATSGADNPASSADSSPSDNTHPSDTTSPVGNTTPPPASNGPVSATVSLADSSDYYIGTMVGAQVQAAFESAGAKVDVLDAATQISTQLQQIQNAVTKGTDIIYVFPVGDAEAYHDPLVAARQAGVKVIVSNNDPGEGAYDVYVGSEEFYMGAMQAAMVSKWIGDNLPGASQVKVLILESHFNETMAHRCLGMRLIGEQFLRQCDIQNMYFVKTPGNPVTYTDASGNEQSVDEPTGGLILDSSGHAILNPFYDPRVILIENSNRVSTGVTATEAQAALEAAVTNGNSDIQIIMAYGDVGISMSDKVLEMCNAHTLTNSPDKIAVFCSDATDNNVAAIKSSIDSSASVLRGVMAAGDLIATVCDYAKRMAQGENVQDYIMEPLSYELADANGNIITVYYTDIHQLSPDISEFFGE